MYPDLLSQGIHTEGVTSDQFGTGEMTTILIVDDQLTSRQILKQLVSKIEQDLALHDYANPVEALAWSIKNPVDLVLVDYKMPEMNGIEFIRKFRLNPASSHVPVIMVTSIEDRNVRYEALEVGATDFLMKPVDHHECRARCRNMLIQHQQYKIISDRSRWLERRVAEATSEIRLRERETLLRLARAGTFDNQWALSWRDGTGRRSSSRSRLVS